MLESGCCGAEDYTAEAKDVSSHRTNAQYFHSYLKEIKRKYPVLSRKQERELAKRAARGDKAAYEALIGHNALLAAKVAFSAYRRLGCDLRNRIALEDLFSSAIIGLKKAIDKYDYRTGNRLGTYAMHHIRKAINRCISKESEILSVSVIRFEDETNREDKAGLPWEERLPNYSMAKTAEHKIAAIRQALETLSDAEWLCVKLFYYQEFSIPEISRKTGMKEGTIKSHLSRARQKIRDYLKTQIPVGYNGYHQSDRGDTDMSRKPRLPNRSGQCQEFAASLG